MKNWIFLAGILFLSFCVIGCAVPAGGCPYCGYPPGVAFDGERISCQRCGALYDTYLNGSVRAIDAPTRAFGAPVPTNNTGAARQNVNQTGVLLLQDLQK